MIRYEIPSFLAQNDMRDYVASRPALTKDEAVTEWMTNKYKSWIETNINPVLDFVVNIEPAYFDVTFDDAADAKRFLAMMGGREH